MNMSSGNGFWCRVYKHWKGLTTAIVSTGLIIGVIKSLADEEYVTRDEFGSIQDHVLKDDLKPIKDDIEWLTRLLLRREIVTLDNRIQLLESIADIDPDQRRRLNEMRLERRQLQSRLNEIERRPE